MTVAIVIGAAMAQVALVFAVGWYSRKWLVRCSADVQAAVEAAVKECAIQNHCIVKQAADTKEWTGKLSQKMQKELAKRERRRAKEDDEQGGHRG